MIQLSIKLKNIICMKESTYQTNNLFSIHLFIKNQNFKLYYINNKKIK